MINTLYPIFQRWSKTGSVYLISDTHFYDKDRDIIGYTITEQEQIDILKKQIHTQDTLIHLGDVGDTAPLEKLPCYKVLITGNHDGGITKFQQKYTIINLDDLTDKEILLKEKNHEIDYWNYNFQAPFKRGYKNNNLFNEIYTGPLLISQKIILSHEPLSINLYATNQPVIFNIHGHDHSGNYYQDEYHLNICQNIFGYEPLNLKKFIQQGLLNKFVSIHQAAIDYQTKRKNEKY